MRFTSFPLSTLRQNIREALYCDHTEKLHDLILNSNIDQALRERITQLAIDLVGEIRNQKESGLLEEFFREYGLSTKEGVALMSLAEALMRIPDAETKDALIEDKIAKSEWGKHLGNSGSSLVNVSTFGLMAAGTILEETSESLSGIARGLIKRLGEPVIRAAVGQAMKLLGDRFVLAETVRDALVRSKEAVSHGYTYSYDMLGEAAKTMPDADRYLRAYGEAISEITSMVSDVNDIRSNPGISVKLSAIYPRYEARQHDKAVEELGKRLGLLAKMAAKSNLGLNIDAEELERLDLSLEIIEEVLSDNELEGWDGFGVVVQAYSPCASHVIDWLYKLAIEYDRKIMVRLVKGAYWDSEIKRAQQLGMRSFPVYTRKAATDVSYIACAEKLLGLTSRIYSQFATHNAHTAAAILQIAREKAVDIDDYEFQRLHGMGDALHQTIHEKERTRSRIYAPVGVHHDLLAYLVRRLLENGANSSFINQIADDSITPEEIAADPFEILNIDKHDTCNENIKSPLNLYEGRSNSIGWDLCDTLQRAEIISSMNMFRDYQWSATPLTISEFSSDETIETVNPANVEDTVGSLITASLDDVEKAIENADKMQGVWGNLPANTRGSLLNSTATLYEKNYSEIFSLLIREAGKTYEDCIAELREAVDFLRYYAAEAVRLEGVGRPRGVVTCISPWNFPLAIFTGQIAGALAAGNTVLAKPAEVTPLIASFAVSLMHEAGIPVSAVQLLTGKGHVIGQALTGDPRISGVCFTGSLRTAQAINRSLAEGASEDAMFIAETGGLNAMIVDTTALPEQVVTDVITSAFQSAGQRCSALRVLYIQEDIAEKILEMLSGAMDQLQLGDPWQLSTDIGPVISEDARKIVLSYIDQYEKQNRVYKQLQVPSDGNFVPPTVVKVSGVEELKEEIFGPVLHVATFKSHEIDKVISAINNAGYGLTFGLHSRINARVYDISGKIKSGNIYVNRNQIGAIVESQPFGGEGLSGTGPKAGGPSYVKRFLKLGKEREQQSVNAAVIDHGTLQQAVNNLIEPSREAINTRVMPSTVGESNTLSVYPRGKILCLGPTQKDLARQISYALDSGCSLLALAPDGYEYPETIDIASGRLTILKGTAVFEDLEHIKNIAAVCFFGVKNQKKQIRLALSAREGGIIPLITESCGPEMYQLERHVCINTAAAGGDTDLLDLDDRIS